MKTYPMKARIRAEGGATRIDIMDDIGEDPFFGGGISAAAFTDQLSKLRGPLDVHISSAGGMVDQGLAIYNALASYPGPVTTYNDGLAASVASVIMQAGSKRVASPVSALMIHDAWGAAQGNAADMEQMRSALDKNSDIIARAYANRAGGTVEQWRQVMKATAWYDADEALEAGLIDEIAGGAFKPAAAVDLDAVAAHAPARIMAALRSLPKAAAGDNGDDSGDSGDGAVVGAKCKTCKGKGRLPHPVSGKNGAQCPSCGGKGTYDPDNDGDDDSTAEGDTDHDYVLPDGSPGPKAPSAMTFEQLRDALRPVFAEWLHAEVARMAAAKDGAPAGPENSTDKNVFSQRLKQIRAALPTLNGADE
jgi:ATP-dependent Clp endopeptidase proteolytic subunit ClpP